jgi:hypothetical protein
MGKARTTINFPGHYFVFITEIERERWGAEKGDARTGYCGFLYEPEGEIVAIS